MSTQLDPVTGAPLLTPDLGSIDQLPYKVQPVPLQDQTNQPQLGRPYLYPDDVPPVLANINAMNGTQPDQAQTLHTDGEHRLLVASSGGGGGVTPTKYAFNGGGHVDIAPGALQSFGQFPTPKAIYGVLCDWAFNDVGPFPSVGPIYWDLSDLTLNNGLMVAKSAFYIVDATAANVLSGAVIVYFNPPIDPFLSGLDSGGEMTTFAVNTSPSHISASMAVIHSGI